MEFSPVIAKLLKTILRFARKKKKKVYIVGGYLRDTLLSRNKDNPDIDFCLKIGAINFGRQLSRVIKAGFVVLDKGHGACRLVKRIKDKVYTLDFTDFRGKGLKEDLLHRDFTINALAMELGTDTLIDLYQAKKDLKSKILRVANKTAFDEDPLRILRAFSFSCIFNFRIEPSTLNLIKTKKSKLVGVSGERVRDELFKILDSPFAWSCLQQMDKLKILKIIFPEIEKMRDVSQGPYHHLDIWRHTLETVKQLEGVVKELKNNAEVLAYLNEVISSDRKRRALLKLGAFLHDVGKPKALRYRKGKITFYGHERFGLEITENIARRLRLSNDELDSLRKMILCHLRPGYLADHEKVSPRAKFRYFRDAAQEGISVLLLSLADQRATKGRLTTRQSRLRHERLIFSFLKEYFRKQKEYKPKRLINGNDLIKKFRLEPSPLIGRILSELEELQAIGMVKTKEQALQKAKGIIKKETKCLRT